MSKRQLQGLKVSMMCVSIILCSVVSTRKESSLFMYFIPEQTNVSISDTRIFLFQKKTENVGESKRFGRILIKCPKSYT